MKALGTHIVCELSGCDARALSDLEHVKDVMVTAAREANATVMETAFHRFQPQGVSGVVVSPNHIFRSIPGPRPVMRRWTSTRAVTIPIHGGRVNTRRRCSMRAPCGRPK